MSVCQAASGCASEGLASKAGRVPVALLPLLAIDITCAQVFILDSLAQYETRDTRDAEKIAERVLPRLQVCPVGGDGKGVVAWGGGRPRVKAWLDGGEAVRRGVSLV